MGCSSTNVEEETQKKDIPKNENKVNKENEKLVPAYPYGFIGPLNKGECYYYPDNMNEVNTGNKKNKKKIILIL